MSSKASSAYIAGPIRDTVFLIAAPLVAIVAFVPFGISPSLKAPLPTGTIFNGLSLSGAFLTAVITAHLFIVIFRSHLNYDIFKLHPLRFTIVPIGLFLAMLTSIWALALVGFVAVYWDVYHSAMQTFGIGRIYDMKRGNGPLVGRRLDMMLNLLLYVGPIIGGSSLALHVMAHNVHLAKAPELQAAIFEYIPAGAGLLGRTLTYAALSLGTAFLVYYVYAYWRLRQQGYRVSLQKVFLLVILAAVSIACWGFNSFGEAMFVMNFFHAWQYFFIVWHMERRNIAHRLKLDWLPHGQQMALALFVFAGVGFGVWTTLDLHNIQFSGRTMASLVLVVSIMHFWYDGFIWSVRKGQVR